MKCKSMQVALLAVIAGTSAGAAKAAVAAEVLLLVAFLSLPPLPDLLGGGWPTPLGWAFEPRRMNQARGTWINAVKAASRGSATNA